MSTPAPAVFHTEETRRPPESAFESADDFVSVPANPDRVFDTTIDDNHRVCSACYTRLRETEPFSWEVGNRHGDYVRFIYIDRPAPHETEHPELDTEYFEQPTIPGRSPKAYPPSKTGAANELRGSRYCRECGEFDAERPPTRSIAQLHDVAANVSMTLTEYGVTHDWLLLMALIADLKRSPVTDGDDHEVLKRAVAEAIRKAK